MHYSFASAATRRPWKLLLAGLLPCVLLAGCGGGGGGGGGSSTVVTAPVIPILPPAPTPAVTQVSAPALQNFTVSLAENSATVAVGGTVTYTLTLTNTSSASATVIVDTVSSQSVPKAVLHVTNPSGVTVYPVARPGIPHDNPPPAPPSLNLSATLAPGQSLTAITRAVSAFATAGTYQAVATFTVAPTAADATQTVTLSPLAVTAQ